MILILSRSEILTSILIPILSKSKTRYRYWYWYFNRKLWYSIWYQIFAWNTLLFAQIDENCHFAWLLKVHSVILKGLILTLILKVKKVIPILLLIPFRLKFRYWYWIDTFQIINFDTDTIPMKYFSQKVFDLEGLWWTQKISIFFWII